MKTIKNFFLLAFSTLFFVNAHNLNAQVTIGDEKAPEDFSILELTSTTGGLRLPQLTTAQRNALSVGGNALANGLTIYNTDIDCLETWNGVDWVSNCGTIASSPASFDINGAGQNMPAFTNLDLTAGSSVTLKVVVNDTEVGNTFTYQWYVQDITEQYANRGFTKLDNATSDELTLSSIGTRSNKRYYCQVVKVGSTEVVNSDYCRVLIGGCGANVGTNDTWVEFQCHNLGAIENADPFTNSASILGDNYQFGTKTPVLTRVQSLQYYYAVPFEWPTPTNTTADWLPANDPCPAGWSIMTKAQAEKIVAYSKYIPVGYDWKTREDNFSSGIAIGYYLFFPATGWRVTDTGEQASRGYNTFMWTNATNGTYINSAYRMRLYRQQETITGSTSTVSGSKRAAHNIRCVKN